MLQKEGIYAKASAVVGVSGGGCIAAAHHIVRWNIDDALCAGARPRHLQPSPLELRDGFLGTGHRRRRRRSCPPAAPTAQRGRTTWTATSTGAADPPRKTLRIHPEKGPTQHPSQTSHRVTAPAVMTTLFKNSRFKRNSAFSRRGRFRAGPPLRAFPHWRSEGFSPAAAKTSDVDRPQLRGSPRNH